MAGPHAAGLLAAPLFLRPHAEHFPMIQTSEFSAEELALLRLHQTPGLGRVGLERLLGCFGSAANALTQPRNRWHSQAGLSRRLGDTPAANDRCFLQLCDQLQHNQVRLLRRGTSDYPAPLQQLSDPPALLYLQGRLPTQPALAIVGSRHASADGLRLAFELGRDLARAGFCIVSGLARGIDGAAHQGALEAQGHTVAVLGGGIDRIYPPEHARLHQQLAERGGLLSEYAPGTAPRPGHFPGRNRIISALCQGILIVEAGEKSGSLITAEFALELGRDVFAVPGSPLNPTCRGSLQLLKDGATLVTSADDVLAAYALAPSTTAPLTEAGTPGPAAPAGLDDRALQVFRLLDGQPRHCDELAGRCGLTPMELSAIVLHLELQGLARACPGGCYIKA